MVVTAKNVEGPPWPSSMDNKTLAHKFYNRNYNLNNNQGHVTLESQFDFENYKSGIIDLLRELGDDVISTSEKLIFTEKTFNSVFPTVVNLQFYTGKIVGKFDEKLENLLGCARPFDIFQVNKSPMRQNYLTNNLYEMETKSMDIDEMVTYIKQKFLIHKEDLNHLFPKSKAGKYDEKLCKLLQQIYKAIKYLQETNPNNAMERVTIDLKQQFITSLEKNISKMEPGSMDELYENPKKYIKFDQKYIYEEVLQIYQSQNFKPNNFGGSYYEAPYNRTFSSRDELIQLLNSVCENTITNSNVSNRQLLNLETIMQEKLFKTQGEIKNKLKKQFEDAFKRVNKETNYDHEFDKILASKNQLQTKLDQLQRYHMKLKNAYNNINIETMEKNRDFSQLYQNTGKSFYKGMQDSFVNSPLRKHSQIDVSQFYDNPVLDYGQGKTQTSWNNNNPYNNNSNMYDLMGSKYRTAKEGNFGATPNKFRESFVQAERKNNMLNFSMISNEDLGKTYNLEYNKKQIEKMVDTPFEADICLDPEVSKIYQEILNLSSYDRLQEYYNKIKQMSFSLTNLDYCIRQERLIYSITSIYQRIDQLQKDLEYFQNEIGEVMHAISDQLSNNIIKSLDDIYYFQDCNEKTPIGCIDRIFDEISDLIYDAKKDDRYIKSAFQHDKSLQQVPPGKFMDDKEFNKYDIHNESQVFIKDLASRMTGSTFTDDLKKLSELIGIAVFKLSPDNADDPFVYDPRKFEQNLHEACHFSLNTMNFSYSKYICYYINSKGPTMPVDFYKVYMCVFNNYDELALDLFEISYMQKDGNWQVYMNCFEDLNFDSKTSMFGKFKPNVKFMNKVDIKYDRELENYDYSILSKMMLAIYKVFYKEMCVAKKGANNLYRQGTIVISLDDAFDFQNFLKNGNPNVLFKPKKMKTRSQRELETAIGFGEMKVGSKTVLFSNNTKIPIAKDIFESFVDMPNNPRQSSIKKAFKQEQLHDSKQSFARDINRYASEIDNQMDASMAMESSGLKMRIFTVLNHSIKRNVKILEDNISPFNENNKLIYALVSKNYEILDMLKKKDIKLKEPVRNCIDEYERQLNELQNNRNLLRVQQKFCGNFLDNVQDFWRKVEDANKDQVTDIFKEDFYAMQTLLNKNMEKVRSNMMMNPKNNSFRTLVHFYKEFGNLIRRSDDETRHEILAKNKRHRSLTEPLYDDILRNFQNENINEISKRLTRYWEKIDDKNEMTAQDTAYKFAMDREELEKKKRVEREREEFKREDDQRKKREYEEKQRRFFEEKERQVRERVELEKQRRIEDERARWEAEERERARREALERQERDDLEAREIRRREQEDRERARALEKIHMDDIDRERKTREDEMKRRLEDEERERRFHEEQLRLKKQKEEADIQHEKEMRRMKYEEEEKRRKDEDARRDREHAYDEDQRRMQREREEDERRHKQKLDEEERERQKKRDEENWRIENKRREDEDMQRKAKLEDDERQRRLQLEEEEREYQRKKQIDDELSLRKREEEDRRRKLQEDEDQRKMDIEQRKIRDEEERKRKLQEEDEKKRREKDDRERKRIEDEDRRQKEEENRKKREEEDRERKIRDENDRKQREEEDRERKKKENEERKKRENEERSKKDEEDRKLKEQQEEEDRIRKEKEEERKKSEASNPEKPKKDEGGKKFGGGMRGLRDLARTKDPEEDTKPGTKKLEGTRLIKRDDLDIVTEYIASQMPLNEDQIQMELERIPFNSDTVSFLFQEYLRMKIFFLFDYMDTIKMNESLEKMIKNDNVYAKNAPSEAEAIGLELNQVFQQTTQSTENPPDTCILLFPVIPHLETSKYISENLDIICVVVNVAEQRALIVPFEPVVDINDTIKKYNENSDYQNLAKFYLMVSNCVILDQKKAAEFNKVLSQKNYCKTNDKLISIPCLPDGVVQFFESLENEHYLLQATLAMNLFYEPSSNGYDIESLTNNLTNGDFETYNALRLVSNVHAVESSGEIEQQMPVFAQMMMETVTQLNTMPDMYVDFCLPDQMDLPEILIECETSLKERIAEVLPTKSKFFFAMDFMTHTMEKATFYLVIEEKIGYLLYLDCNDTILNEKILEIIKTTLLNQGVITKLEIYYESPKHIFISSSPDIFLGVVARYYAMMGDITIPNILRIMSYNALPIVSMFGDDDTEGGTGMSGDDLDAYEGQLEQMGLGNPGGVNTQGMGDPNNNAEDFDYGDSGEDYDDDLDDF